EHWRNGRQKWCDESGQLRPLPRGVEKRLQILRKKGDIFARAVFQNESETTGRSDDGDCRGRKCEPDAFAETGELFIYMRLDCLILFFRFRSFAPRFEPDKEKCAVGILGETQQAESNDGGGVLHTRRFAQKILDLTAGLLGAFERRRVGQLKLAKVVPLVFIRQEAAGQSADNKP